MTSGFHSQPQQPQLPTKTLNLTIPARNPQQQTTSFPATLTAKSASTTDQHHLTISAQLYEPEDPSRSFGGIVLIQEIFGVNRHIREVASRYAKMGFTVLVPAFFDHIKPGIEFDQYDADAVAHGRELVQTLGWDIAVRDVEAAILALQKHSPHRAIAVLGYCWGGSLAFLAACRLPADQLACAISYYGRQTFDFREETPQCPVLFHFGEHDPSIPLANVRAVIQAQPDQEAHLYPAGHGFNCNYRSDYHPESAALAERRTVDFLKRHFSAEANRINTNKMK